jgi:hypothetical protein
MDLALSAWQRPTGLLVQALLDPGRAPLPPSSSRQQRPPNYPCNSDLNSIEALPTLVPFPGSNNYKDDKPGVLWDESLQRKVEPNADERGHLLGYTTGTTAAPYLSEADCFRLTGQYMDSNQLKEFGSPP